MSSVSTLDLSQVKAQFQSWRKERVGRERIPAHLWALAIELLNHYPINIVQRELLLNLNQLKQRAADNRQLDKHSLSKQQFLEIKPAEIAAITDQTQVANNRRQIDSIRAVTEGSCRIAFERSDGSRLTIQLPANSNIIPAICANLLRE